MSKQGSKLLPPVDSENFGILTKEGWFVGTKDGPYRFSKKQAMVLSPFYEERLKQPVEVVELTPTLSYGGQVHTDLDIRGRDRALRKAKKILATI